MMTSSIERSRGGITTTTSPRNNNNNNENNNNKQQPAIVIDPSVKESIYSMIEAQRHSHELVVTQLMVALEETHRECRFLRQQLSTSNEMLQDSQLQLRRAVEDKETLLSQMSSTEKDSAQLRQENGELKLRVQEDMKELTEVREMVKNAMEETYRSGAALHRSQYNQNSNNNSESSSASPSRQMLNGTKNVPNYNNSEQQQDSYYSPVNNNNATSGAPRQGYGSSDFPASTQGIRAGVAFGAVSPPRQRGDVSGTESGEFHVGGNNNNNKRFSSPVDLSVNRNSAGEMTVRADPNASINNNNNSMMMNNNNNNNSSNAINDSLIAPSVMNMSNNSSAASVPRSLIGNNQSHQQNPIVSIAYRSSSASSNNANEGNNNQSIFRPITVDMNLSRAVSVSSQGHVSISVAREEINESALCCYRDLRSSSSSSSARGGYALIFEASFRSADPRSILVGLATVKSLVSGSDSNNTSSSSTSLEISKNNNMTQGTNFSQAITASSGLGARCAIRGDGMLLLATEDGNVFEARSGLSVVDNNANNNSDSNNNQVKNGVITVRLEEMTSRVTFALNGDNIHTVPLQVPRTISAAKLGGLVPFVSLPCSGDEVVVRAPTN